MKLTSLSLLRLAGLFLLLVMSCNFPTRKLSSDSLRQTMAAPLPATALPGETQLPPPDPNPTGTAPPSSQPLPAGYGEYRTRSGDTLEAVASRFGVEPGQVILPAGVSQPGQGFLPPDLPLAIPLVLAEVTSAQALLPDSELVYSPSSVDFDVPAYIFKAGGYLSTYSEDVDDEQMTGAAIIQRVASELSVNPRLLLAFLELRSHWVLGEPADPGALTHPIGFYVPGRSGLYEEVRIAATQLNVAYYGWRQGNSLEIEYADDRVARLNPALNAGSAALQHLFALLYHQSDWSDRLYGANGFASLYTLMFGDPWGREVPLFPQDLAQPPLELPFSPGERWSLTAGPHTSWNAGTPRGALDFSPVTGEAVCAVSSRWVTASTPGVIVRSGYNSLALDLDGDGLEQTGWVLVYLHLAAHEIQPTGLRVNLDDPLGHPSCEGGRATGKHVHIARKYNGEWLPADGALPFVLGGWTAHADDRNYYGTLEKDGQFVSASPGGAGTSVLTR